MTAVNMEGHIQLTTQYCAFIASYTLYHQEGQGTGMSADTTSYIILSEIAPLMGRTRVYAHAFKFRARLTPLGL